MRAELFEVQAGRPHRIDADAAVDAFGGEPLEDMTT
jgi:hypothetical protein